MGPLQFLLFGNPRTGGALLAQNPAVALNLPLKIIAWEDALHHVRMAYNDPATSGSGMPCLPQPPRRWNWRACWGRPWIDTFSMTAILYKNLSAQHVCSLHYFAWQLPFNGLGCSNPAGAHHSAAMDWWA